MTLADVRQLVEELADELTGLHRQQAIVALQALDAVQARAGVAQDTLGELRAALLDHQRALDALRAERLR